MINLSRVKYVNLLIEIPKNMKYTLCKRLKKRVKK